MLSSPSRSLALLPVTASPLPPREPRPAIRAAMMLAGYLVAFSAAGAGARAIVACNPAQKQDIKSVVDKAAPTMDLGCALGSHLTNAEELAAVCGFAKEVLPFVRQLVSYREEGRRSGVVWTPTCSSVDASACTVAGPRDARAGD